MARFFRGQRSRGDVLPSAAAEPAVASARDGARGGAAGPDAVGRAVAAMMVAAICATASRRVLGSIADFATGADDLPEPVKESTSDLLQHPDSRRQGSHRHGQGAGFDEGPDSTKRSKPCFEPLRIPAVGAAGRQQKCGKRPVRLVRGRGSRSLLVLLRSGNWPDPTLRQRTEASSDEFEDRRPGERADVGGGTGAWPDSLPRRVAADPERA